MKVKETNKYWCSKKGRAFTHNYNLKGGTCPECGMETCDFGPVVVPDAEQKAHLEDIVHQATRNGPPDYSRPPSKYHIPVIGIDTQTGDPRRIMVDVYAIQVALNQTPQVAHSFKKLWAAGKRSGGKSYKQDIVEARTQLEMELNRLELEERFDG